MVLLLAYGLYGAGIAAATWLCVKCIAECPEPELIIANCEPFLQFERSRSTPVKIGKEWVMKECDVNIAQHVKTVTVTSEAHMMEKMNEIMATDLEGYGVRPLWSIVRLENSGPGISAIMIRIHHVVGDGIALVEAMRNMFQDDKGNVLKVELPERIRGEANPSMFNTLMRVIYGVWEVLTLAQTKYDTDLSFNSPTKREKLSAPIGTHKSIIFNTYRLEFIKELKNKAKCTINDVYMSVFAGVIRRYGEACGDKAIVEQWKDVQCRVLMPVAFPRSAKELEDQYRALRNKWAFVSINLPVGVHTSAKDRLKYANQQTATVKKSLAAVVQLWFQNSVMLYLPTFLTQMIAFDVFRRHSIILSNVPGPAGVVMYGRHKLLGLQFFFPNLLPQYDVVSYNGGVFACLTVPAQVVKKTDDLGAMFHDEMVALAESFGVSTAKDYMLSPVSDGGVFGIATKN